MRRRAVILHFSICIIQFAFINFQNSSFASASLYETIRRVEPKIVKIHGAGGFQGLEAYQTGMLVSPEGHVLTAFSHVLDTDRINVVLHDGRRFDAKLLGADPKLEAAVLKIDAAGLSSFDLSKAVRLEAGQRVLAFSNLFGVAAGAEPVSVQQGVVAVVAGLEGQRGAYDTPYHGPVYVLDATTNNPGAAGGALVDRRGRLAGMLGKELRNARNHIWLNYAVPIEPLRQTVEDILAGRHSAGAAAVSKPLRPLDLAQLGIVLVPDVLERTPPYVDQVRPGSRAERSGVRPDDLVVLLGDRLVQSCKILAAELQRIDADDAVSLTVLRGGEMIEISLGKEPP